MKIGVVGTGYVGLTGGACLADLGHQVTCIDIDASKIKLLENGTCPFYEPGLPELISKVVSTGRLRFSSRVSEAIDESDIVFVAVGTPPLPDGSTNLEYIHNVAKEFSHSILRTGRRKLLVTKSTVPVGTGASIVETILSEGISPDLFSVVSNPEFLREGTAVNDFFSPDRIVIGGNTPESVEAISQLYTHLASKDCPIIKTSLETAELIKYAANTFLATKISFTNELSNLCDQLGADIRVVTQAMGLDKRIGAAFLNPGPGFGGSCLPKDTQSLLHTSRSNKAPLTILEAVINVNLRQKTEMINRMIAHFGALDKVTVSVLGCTFKANTDDIRESAAIDSISSLLEHGARVRIFDPQALGQVQSIFGDTIVACDDAYKAAETADCVLIMTEWNEFKYLDLDRLKSALNHPIIFDCRNLYAPASMKAAGFSYHCFGRPLV